MAQPLGGAEAEATKRALGWDQLPFTCRRIVCALARRRQPRLRIRRAWLKRLAKHPQRAEFERVMDGQLPEGWVDAMALYKAALATEAQARHAPGQPEGPGSAGPRHP